MKCAVHLIQSSSFLTSVVRRMQVSIFTEIGFTRLHRRDRGHRWLDDKAGLQNGCRTSAYDALVYADWSDRSAAEKRPVAPPTPDMSVKFHSRQKMPQRTTAYTEFGREFTLGWKFVTVSQRVLGHEGQQFVGLDGFGLSFRFVHLGQVRIDKRSFSSGYRLL